MINVELIIDICLELSVFCIFFFCAYIHSLTDPEIFLIIPVLYTFISNWLIYITKIRGLSVNTVCTRVGESVIRGSHMVTRSVTGGDYRFYATLIYGRPIQRFPYRVIVKKISSNISRFIFL